MNVSAASLRLVWLDALSVAESSGSYRDDSAEQVAWDAFRDACEVEFPHGSCPHPECPDDAEVEVGCDVCSETGVPIIEHADTCRGSA